MRVVLGLGNPGRRYARTRHNVGFRAVDALAARLGARFRLGTIGEDAEVARATAGGEEIVIAKPLTMMNQSGRAAGRLAAVCGAGPEDLLVAYDDVALPLGSIRIRPSGRSAGQKGMESIIQTLGSEAIPRVRMGILGERDGADLAEYVLEPFLPGEEDAAEAMIDTAAKAMLGVLESGVRQAMNEYNRRREDPA